MWLFRNWANWRRLRYVLVTLAAIVPIWFLAISYMLLTPPSYEASMTLILPGEGPTASLTLDELGQASTHSASPWSSSRLSPVESYRKLMMTDSVRRRASAARDMEKDDFPEPKIKLVDQTNLMMISLRGKSQEGAEANARAFLDAFNAELGTLRSNFTAERETANRAAIDEHKSAATEAQRAILEFKMKSGLNSSENYAEILEKTRKLANRLEELSTEQSRLTGEITTLESNLGITVALAAMALELRSDLAFQALLQEGATLKIDYEKARRRYGVGHPEFRAISRRYLAIMDALERRGQVLTGLSPAQFRRAADLASDGARESLMLTLVENATRREGLRSEAAEVEKNLGEARIAAVELAAPAAELDRLTRDYQVAEAVFASALARADTTKTDLFSAYPLAQIVEPPLASEKPVSPSKKIGLVAAIAGSIFVIMGLALAWLRRPILRWVAKLFVHPGREVAEAAVSAPALPVAPPQAAPPTAQRQPAAAPAMPPPPETPMAPPLIAEPPPPAPIPLDDEPLIEIPYQLAPKDRLPEALPGNADTA